MSDTYRHSRTYCQVTDCRRRIERAVDIEIPTDWQPTFGFRVVTVTVGTCRQHGKQFSALVAALLEARVEHYELVQIIAAAVETDAAARRLVEEMERAHDEAEGAVAFQRERADRAERQLHRVRAAAAPSTGAQSA